MSNRIMKALKVLLSATAIGACSHLVITGMPVTKCRIKFILVG